MLNFKNIIAIIFFLSIGGYAYSNSRDVLAGPEIVIESPTNGATVNATLLEIVGQALRSREMLINGKPVTLTQEGKFNEYLLLSPGYNVINLKAIGKFGGDNEKKLELVLK